MKIRSSIKSALKKRVLFKGTLLAGIGVCILFYSGTMLPAEKLQEWGLGLFLLSFLLIAMGMLPYRRLTQLEMVPNEIIFEDEGLLYVQKQQTLLWIPLQSIDKCWYVEKGDRYGIAFVFKKPRPAQIVKYHKKIKLQKWEGSELFLPYFTQRSVKELNESLIGN